MKPFDMIVKFKFKTEIVGKKPLYCTNITFSSGCRSIETLVFHASQKGTGKMVPTKLRDK